ncbi:hypothetical protein GCM10008905_28670 [Clostridium malenominatum]|uniref:FMN-binding domain-containing protein n=1 Tax=Clostridium malenominatum TaxID=1539 RepID=A0ABN1J567_9CLOT
MKKFKGTIVLLLITSICGLILGVAHGATKDIIAERERLESLQLSVILPKNNANDVKQMDVNLEGVENVSGVFEALENGEVVGHAVIVTTNGFGGPIKMTVGITKEGKIGGIKIVSHGETPGIGTVIEDEKLLSKYRDKEIKEKLKLVKGTAAADNEIESITGASISSGAMVAGVNTAINFYKEQILGEESSDPSKKEVTVKDAMPEGDEMKPFEVALGDNIAEVQEVYKGGQVIGYAITAISGGYSDSVDLKTLVGISLEGKITGIRVVQNGETPGVGDVILDKDFTDRFVDKSAAKPLEFGSGENAVETVSGATLSSEGVVYGVNNAIKFFNESLKK